MHKEWLINKNKFEKKAVKNQKSMKEGATKHKRVKSDANAVATKMFSDTLQSSQVGHTNANSKKLLKTVTNKTGTVYSYQSKKLSNAVTTRMGKKDKKPISRGQYMSEKNTFKKPKGYKIMAKKSAENSPATTHNQMNVINETSGKPPAKARKSKTSGHNKNSMSTHVKRKNNYFYTQEDEFQEDIEEFPSDEIHPQNRKTDSDKHNDDDSSLLKYQEYKRMYFDDAKIKKNKQIMESNYATEQNKYKKLLNTHFNKGMTFFGILNSSNNNHLLSYNLNPSKYSKRKAKCK